MQKKLSNLIAANTIRKLVTTAVICAYSLTLFAQGNLHGKVTDEAGEPLAGASITVKGSTQGVMSDVDGGFKINVSSGATLVVSYIGYVKQEVPVGSKTFLEIVLKEDAQALGEVVVVGYGMQKKASLTGSVASVSADELRNIPVSNLSSALSGKLSGVRINSYTGSPGTSSGLTIRSAGTWNNASPLYVIDGVIRGKTEFDALNPNDVESLSVLKDGTSAAVYGSRAANGVVLVSTRKGTIGKPVIAYSGIIGTSSPTILPQRQSAYNQALAVNDKYQDQLRDRIANAKDEGKPASSVTWDPTAEGDYYTSDELDFYKTHNWDWLEGENGFLRNPTVTQHSLNVSGGNEAVRYFAGGSYHSEGGIFDNIQYDKYNIRSNIEAKITKNLTGSLNLNMSSQNRDRFMWEWDRGNDTQYDLFKALLVRTQMVPAYIDGKPVGLPFVEWHPGVLINGDGGYNRVKNQQYEATAALEYKVPVVEGLSLKLLYNKYNGYQFTKQTWLPYMMYNVNTTGGHSNIPDLANPGLTETRTRNDGNRLRENESMSESYQLNGFITYARQFGKHDVGAMFVYEQAESSNDWFEAQRNDYKDLSVDQMDAGGTTNLSAPTGSGSEDGRLSYIGRINYGFDNKYLVEASFRYDGSVKFAPENRWGFFPSGSLAWRISEEGFFKDNVPLFNNLKIRGGIGMLGNDAVGGWQWARRYGYTTGQYYGAASDGIALATDVHNPNITWEKSILYDGGVDAALLNNRLSVSANLFYRFTYDILGSRIQSLPSSFGASMPSVNYGEMSTKGYELELRWNDRVGDIDYYFKGNLGNAKSKLLKWDEAENIRPYQSKIGLTSNNLDLGLLATGIIRTQEEADAILAANPEYRIYGNKPRPGMMNYRDIRGPNSDEPDGMIDDNDREYIQQNLVPTLNYGFGLGANYKGVALDLFFQGVGQYDVMVSSGSGARGVQARKVETNMDFWTDHWTPENPNASMPRIENNQADRRSTFWMKNGAYLRLKSVTLSYDIPKQIMTYVGVSGLKVFFEGQNLLLLEDHIKWFDPEIGNQSNNIYCYPNVRSFTVGINLTL